MLKKFILAGWFCGLSLAVFAQPPSGGSTVYPVITSNGIVKALGFVPGTGSGSGGGIVTNGGTGNNNILTNSLMPVQNFGLAPLESAGVSGQSTNQNARDSFGFSINVLNTVFLQKALNNAATHKIKLMWFGDSTGSDSVGSFQTFFSSNYVYGIEPILVLQGPSSYFDLPNGVLQTTTPSWWGAVFSATNGVAQTYGIRNSTPVYANNIAFWYNVSNAFGTNVIYTSTLAASNTWTLRATVDSSAGFWGVHLTNISLPLGNYYIKISNNCVATTPKTNYYMWAQLENTNSTSVELFDGHVGGALVGDWLNMGTNSIASLITNYQPDVIFWQQTKPVSSFSSFSGFYNQMKTYATNTDIVLIQSQESADPTVYNDPANGGQFQLPVIRAIALSNDWTFIDNRTPFSSWTNVVIPAGLTNNGVGGIHFGPVGMQISGNDVLIQMQMLGKLANSGTLKLNSLITNQFDPSMVPNLTFRYDPASAATAINLLPMANGGIYPSFKDWSGNGYDIFTISGAGPYYTNNSAEIGGRPYAVFGGGQQMQMSQPTHLAQPSTVFLVLRLDGNSGNYVFDSTNSANGQRNAMLDNEIFAGSDLTYVTETGVWKLFKLKFNNTLSSVFTNDLLTVNGTAGSSTLDGLTLGSRFDSTAKGSFGLAYMLWYNGTVTTTQERFITDWLNTRFNLYGVSYPRPVIQTNWISGLLYTNTSSSDWFVRASTKVTTAAVTGGAAMRLQTGTQGGSLSTLSAVEMQTTVATISMVYTNEICGFIPSGNIFTFTNLSSGSGNTASLNTGTGQLKQF